LYPFEETGVFRKIKDNIILARCNFSVDAEVMRPIETQTLATLTSYFKPNKIFEIGTYSGYSTLHLACNSPEDSTIYTLDLPPAFDLNNITGCSFDDFKVAELSKKNVNSRIFTQVPALAKKVVELFGDSKTFDFSSYYGNIDLVFIDGCHSHEYVRCDTENAFKMLSKNGVIIWHDYDYVIHRDVFDYLNYLVKTQKQEIYFIKNTRLAIYGDLQ
jgi:predicted O-methyltransferase YrrM